jgi:NAD(P) transhydrogenase subunit alpha
VEASDIVITTAAIPGRKAPLLVTKEMVQRMRNGAVIVDLAADTGGNCEVTVAGTETDFAGVTVVGIRDMPTTVPRHASLTYSKNLLNLVSTYVKDGVFALDFEDEIIKGTCVVRDSKVVYQPPQARPAPSTEVASNANLGEKEN